MTESLLQKHKFRIAGTRECRLAAHDIADSLKKTCDSVSEEQFNIHPRALWYVGKAISIIYLTSSLLLLSGGYFVHVSTLLCFLGLIYGLVQYVLYGKLFDPLFPSSIGCNVSGTLEPTDNIKNQIIIVGHHDSPFIFSFLTRYQRIAYIRFLLGILAYLFLTVSATTQSFHQLIGGGNHSLHGPSVWIIVVGMLFALPLFFMMSSQPSPGAGDNLNSTSMATIIASYFYSARHNGQSLKHTRLTFLSTDGEEVGQRGAMSYVEKHARELLALPTFVLNIDSVYYSRDLAVLTRDRNFTCKLSSNMTTDLSATARDLRIHLKQMPLPFGGGGTDAAPFAAVGVEATTIIGMPINLISNDHLYHTAQDTVDHIEPEAVASVLEIAIGYIRLIDSRSQ